jgi:hypothetical protein
VAADDIFGFINDVYSLLPEQDVLRFGELWTAYEQTLGDVWTRLFQSQLASVISTLPNYNIHRWLEHEFDATTQVNLPATYTSNQDVSQGINLSTQYLIKFSVNGGSPVEVNLTGAVPANTTGAEIAAAINVAAGFSLASLVTNNALVQFTSNTTGPSSSITFYPASVPAADASAIVLGLAPADLPETFPEFPYIFMLVDSTIVSIPALQDFIRPQSVTIALTENVDYSIEFGSGLIAFAVAPPSFMWAPNTLYNYETPYNNFGYLINYYAPNTPAYLETVQGLWFAYWTGPSPENIKRSLYLLFGLPTAAQAGTVTNVTPTTIYLTYNDNSTATFTIPNGLYALVSVGDTVEQYQPLTTGVNVLDKINSPGFLAREVGTAGIQQFLTQNATMGSNNGTQFRIGPNPATATTTTNITIAGMVGARSVSFSVNVTMTAGINVLSLNEGTTYGLNMTYGMTVTGTGIPPGSYITQIIPSTDEQIALQTIEQNTYLPQIDVNAFVSANINLGNVRTFLTNLQPKSRTYLFQIIVGSFADELVMAEDLGLAISFDVSSNVDYNPNTYAQQSDLTDAETDPQTGIILDDGGWSMTDYVDIEVYNGATLVETLHVEG